MTIGRLVTLVTKVFIRLIKVAYLVNLKINYVSSVIAKAVQNVKSAFLLQMDSAHLVLTL